MILDRMFLMILEIDVDELEKKDAQERKGILKKAYHRLAQKYHPDKWVEGVEFSKKEMELKFREVHHAYKMVTDPEYRNKEQNKKGQTSLHAVFNINVTFEQAFFGQKTVITFNPTHLDSEGNPIPIPTEEDIQMEADIVTVIIPPKTRNGDKVVIKNRGLIKGEERGDMIFVFSILANPAYQQDPNDPNIFYGTEKVELETMLIGGKIEVSTIWGLKTARIPAGSRPGDKITVSKLGEDKKGQYIFVIQPEFPTKEKLKEKSIWQRLGINWSKETELDEEMAEKEAQYETLFENLGGFSTFSSTFNTSSSWKNPK